MVATILSLRWRTTVHSLKRDWWRLLVVLAGAVWSLSLIPTLLWASAALGEQGPGVRAEVMSVAGALLVLGWTVVPLLVTGIDDTLDPTRFASLGVPARRLMPGLTVSAFLTVPALFTGLAMLLLMLSWRGDGLAFLVALLGAWLSVAVMVLSGRLAVMWGVRLLSGRRSRWATAAASVIGLVLVALGGRQLVSAGLDRVLERDIPTLIEALGRTPLAAGFAAAEFADYGEWWSVAWRLALLIGWCVLLGWAWKDGVARVLITPPARSGGTVRRDDAVLARAEASAGRASAAARGPLRVLRPGPAVRAVRTRALRYWATDPRYLTAAAGALAGPVLVFGILLPALGVPGWVAFLMPASLAMSVAWGRHNDVAHDSSALWLDVVSGRLGTEVMRGRAEALLVWAAPLVVAASVAAVWVADRWDLLPGLAAASLGVLGTTLGISWVLAVWMPYRAPQPGANPFGAEVGSVGAGLAAQALSSLASVVTAPLVMVPFALAVVVHPAWSAVAVVTGLVLGAFGVVLGVRVSGSGYDARSGKLLGAIQ